MLWASFSQIHRIWIRAANWFERRFGDKYTFWSRVKVKNSKSPGE